MEREPLLMPVHIGDVVVRREAEPLHLCDVSGRLIATCMRPIVRPGETLVEQLGDHPRIISELA